MSSTDSTGVGDTVRRSGRRVAVAMIAALLGQLRLKRAAADSPPSPSQPEAPLLALPSVEALRAVIGRRAGQMALLAGHTVPGDGGGGLFFWTDDAVAPDGRRGAASVELTT